MLTSIFVYFGGPYFWENIYHISMFETTLCCLNLTFTLCQECLTDIQAVQSRDNIDSLTPMLHIVSNSPKQSVSKPQHNFHQH